MSDGFTEMLDRAQAFYGALARNNSKDWFEPRKAQWKADIEGPATLLTEIVAEELSRMTGLGHTPKLFRIYRDVRFSGDKTPYKTRLGMLWSPVEPAPQFYFGIDPDRTHVGCAAQGLDKDGITRFRALVDRDGDRLQQLIDDSGGTLTSIGAAPLKRVPKPYAADHPHAELLRRRSLALSLPLADGWRAGDGLVAALIDRFQVLMPVRDFLARSL